MSNPIRAASAMGIAVLAATLIPGASSAASSAADAQAGPLQAQTVPRQTFSPAVRDIILEQSKDIAGRLKAVGAKGDCFVDSDVKGFKDKNGFANFNGRDRFRSQKANPAINVQRQLRTYKPQ